MKISTIVASALIVAGFASQSFAAAPEAIFKRCTVCHGKNAEKVPPGGTKITADLTADEIKSSLKGYKAGTYGGKMKASMIGQVKSLSDADIDALADYIVTNFGKK
ncbi:MAG: c-type cytochrome [Campylobacteraceae bacterium]